MAVAIDQNDVIGRYGGVPDDLVGGRGAVGNEEQMVGIEDARGIALAGGNRTGVIEQLPQFVDGIADIGAQHVLAEKLMKHLSHRAFQEGHAA